MHTIVLGWNLPVIIQHLPSRPDGIDAMPLLRLMIHANAKPIADDQLQIIVGPVIGT